MQTSPIQFARSRDGASIACSCVGAGPPLMVCSTLATTIGRNDPEMSPLLGNFTIGCLDRRGSGHSSIGYAASIDLFVADILAAADRLGFEAFHLIGYSMGALESVAVAIAAPARVRGLILHAPFPPYWSEQPRSLAWRAALAADWNWFAEAWTRTWGGPGQPATQEMIEHFKATNDPEGFRLAVEAFVTAPSADLSRVAAPTIVIHRNAKWQPITVSEEYARGIPGAELIIDQSPDIWRVSSETDDRLLQFFARTAPDRAEAGQARGRFGATREQAIGAASLSAREREVLELVAQGLSNREIAELLCVSVLTVARHLHNIYAKLEVKNRAGAVARSHIGFPDAARAELQPADTSTRRP